MAVAQGATPFTVAGAAQAADRPLALLLLPVEAPGRNGRRGTSNPSIVKANAGKTRQTGYGSRRAADKPGCIIYNEGSSSACPHIFFMPFGAMTTPVLPFSLAHVCDCLEGWLLRYHELQKTTSLLQQQLDEVTQERDSLKSRLAAARSRVDVLLTRLQSVDPAQPLQASSSAPLAAWGLHDSVDDEAAKDQA